MTNYKTYQQPYNNFICPSSLGILNLQQFTCLPYIPLFISPVFSINSSFSRELNDLRKLVKGVVAVNILSCKSSCENLSPVCSLQKSNILFSCDEALARYS